MPDPPSEAQRASPSRISETQRRSVALAVLVALAVIFAGAAGYWYGRSTQGSTQGSAAPAQVPSLKVHAQGRGIGGLVANVSGASIEVFSVMPLTLETPEVGLDLRSLSPGANPYFVDLGSGTTNATGGTVIPLSSVFESVESEWRAVVGPPTENVSLQLEATYVAINGSNASLYHYYDQIDYNPLVPFTTLVASFVFDLTKPYATGAVSTGLSSGIRAATVSCEGNLTTSWSTVAFSVTAGELPLAGLVDNLSLSNSELVIVGDGWILSPTVEIGFGGVQDAFPGFVEASSDPAWTGVLPNFGEEGAASAAVTNSSQFAEVPTIALTGATYLVVGQAEGVHWAGAGSCGTFELNVTLVTSSIPLAMTGLPLCSALLCRSVLYSGSGANDTGQELEALSGQSLLNSTLLVATSNVQFTELVRPDVGYGSALAAEGAALGTHFVFTLNLGDAILLSDAAEYDCSLGCSAYPSNAYLLTLLAEFGPAVSELPSDGIYGFAAELNASQSGSVQIVGYSNQFVNLTSAALLLYGGTNQTYVNIGGTLYGTSMPDFGPIVCETGTTPGHGC